MAHIIRHHSPGFAAVFDDRLEQDLTPDGLSEAAIVQRLNRLWAGLLPASTASINGLTVGDAATAVPRIEGYRIEETIGFGGMGVVYRAQQIRPLKRSVAIKLIRPEFANHTILRRFETERQALASLDHPGIAKVLDAGVTEDQRPFFVMELVDGIALGRFLQVSDSTLAERLTLFTDLCRAIEHAHRRGIIHRDLKPSNVMVARVDDRLVPRVIDFGLAKAVPEEDGQTTLTLGGQMLGTLQYMSPEQARVFDCPVDIRSDLYSLGVILYQLISGMTPYSGAYSYELLTRIRDEQPAAPSRGLTEPSADRGLRTRMPELDAVCLQCLAKQPIDRYQTVAELREDVERFLCGKRVSARPTGGGWSGRFLWRNLTGCLISLAVLFTVLPTSVDESGPTAGTLQTDGIDDCVVVQSLTWDGSHPVTIEAWVKPNANRPGDVITLGGLINLTIMQDRGVLPAVGAHGHAEMFHLCADAQIALGKWTHLAGVYNGKRLSLYVDGQLQQGVLQHTTWPESRSSDFVVAHSSNDFPDITLSPVWDNTKFSVAGNPWATKEWFSGFDGEIAEVRVSSCIRYNGNFEPNQRHKSDSETMALYHFDDLSDGTVRDASDFGHHGRLFVEGVPGEVSGTDE